MDQESLMTLEHKTVPVSNLKVLDEEAGVVEALVSVTGVEDDVNDVIEPGAYDDTLAKRTPKGVWSHDWDTPVSRTLEVRELRPGDDGLPRETKDGSAWPGDAGALRVKMQFNLETQRGREAFSDVKFFGPEQEWSIGYNVPAGGSSIDEKSGVRRIKKIDLYEYSPVLFGAMPLSATTSVKEAQRALERIKGGGDPGLLGMIKDAVESGDLKAADVRATVAMDASSIAPGVYADEDGIYVKAEEAGLKGKRAGQRIARALRSAINETATKRSAGAKDVLATLRDSHEDLRRRIHDALQRDLPGKIASKYDYPVPDECYPMIEATFDDRVLVSVYLDTLRYFEVPYIAGADREIDIGRPTEVEVRASVVEKALDMVTGRKDQKPDEAKEARVLSQANETRLREALDLIGEVLAAADGGAARESDADEEPDEDTAVEQDDEGDDGDDDSKADEADEAKGDEAKADEAMETLSVEELERFKSLAGDTEVQS